MNFDNNRPIYIQIIEYIKISILNGKYESKTKLPSVRELALYFKINPNTIQRALLELEKEQLIITKRTLGKFVTEDEKKIKKLKIEFANQIIDKFLSNMKELNISKSEIIKLIEERRENKWT